MTAATLATATLQHVSKLLAKLTDAQLTELAEGRAVIEFRSKDEFITSVPVPRTRSRAAAVAKPSIDAMVVAINEFTKTDEVVGYLDSFKLSKADLQAIAVALGPTVSSKGTIAELKRNIAEGTTGFRERAAVMGGWQR